MPKSRLMRIILIVGSILIIVGVSLMTWMLATEEDRDAISVQLDNGKTQSVKFENLSLVPGQECEYTIKLEKVSMDECDLSLDFVETKEGSLKNFARVKILSNGDTVCDKLLADILEGEDIILPVDFSEDKNTELQILYYLPIEVGNEAKKAEAVFELRLTASNE